jgi:transcriptional regulator GlxA family with amidase domain
VTTHWEYALDFAAACPAAIVESDNIFVRDGPVFTSAGATAGIDLALALVEEDYGRGLVLEIARRLVMFVKRSGGQSQFSVHLAAQIAERAPIQQVREWILNNPEANHSISNLARVAGMSERNFSRVFGHETGMTPADYVEAIRIDTARRLLESTTQPLQRVASSSGFASADAMRRAFLGRIGSTPLGYRRRFRTSKP